MTGQKNTLPSSVPWTPAAGLVFLALLLVLSGFSALLNRFLSGFIPGAQWGFYAQILIQIAVSHGGVLAALFLFLYFKSGNVPAMFRISALHGVSPLRLIKAAWLPAVLSAAAIFAWLLLHSILRRWLGYSLTEQPQVEWLRELLRMPERHKLYLALVITVVLAPAVEEFIFRMLLYFPLREKWGAVKAAVIVSLFFSMLHIYPTGGSMTDFIMNALLLTGQLFAVSIFFTVLLERTGSLLSPIIAHAAYNALVVSLVLLGVGGG